MSTSTFPADKARSIRLIALDVDGVLTDASIMLDDHGVETKRFNVRDGLGIVAWMKLGGEIAVITRRSGKAVEHRCKELGIRHLVQGSTNKIEAMQGLLADLKLTSDQAAYIGDDWPDVGLLKMAGLGIAVSDASEPAKAAAKWITQSRGGHGAVREAVEAILLAQGRLHEAIAKYTD